MSAASASVRHPLAAGALLGMAWVLAALSFFGVVTSGCYDITN